MKKNKLYTINRFNTPSLRRNVFADGGPWDKLAGEYWGKKGIPDELKEAVAGGETTLTDAYMNSKNAFGLSKAANPFSRGNLATGIDNLKSAFTGANLGSAAVDASIGAVGTAVSKGINRGLSDGLSSGAGNVVSGIGDAVGGVLDIIPGAGLIARLPMETIAGGINRAIGTSTNEAELRKANAGTASLLNTQGDVNSFDDIKGVTAVEGFSDPYKSGFLRKGNARRKNASLREARVLARQFANGQIENNIMNLNDNQLNDALANYSAFGGLLDTPNYFAIGGDLQTHGGDFSDGLTIIGAGGRHETNPNEGVQLGVDNEGTPNLVEENETIYNDYVFSNRILADESTKQMFRLPKKKDITFSDISKRLEKEIAERVNDPISKAGFEKQMQMLEEQQERQKQEMEAERAKAAFEALSPEEQTALMQQKAEQEAMAQQAAIQEATAQQQIIPEELTIAQQQQQMAYGSDAAMAYTPEELAQSQQNISALGGELVKASDVEPNRFDYGGKKGSRKAKRIARKYNEQWFKNMAKSLGISDKEMEGFVYSADDPEANLVAFNNIYRDNQYNKSKDIYRKGQRQSKRNELFGDRGLYSYSDDKYKIYKARTNDADRTGWINKDYTGTVDAEGKMLGFLSQEEYDKLKPEEKEAYKRINERAGDRMYDYNGRIIKDLYNGTEDELLNNFDADYDKGFKWDDKDAQTLQYPVGMEHSATSAMRYIPAIGGVIGLAHDIFSNPDYSRPQAIIEASRGLATPSQIQPHYIGNYLTYRPMDIWHQQNALNAQSRATDRALTNNSGGNRGTAMAGLIANGYNSQLASGNLFRQAQEYNDALNQKKEDFNRGTNIFNANADMDSQKTNTILRQQAGRLGMQGLMTGYGMMDDIDARRQASMNANLTNVLQSLGNIGEEAYDEDRLRWLEKTGTLKSRTLSANGGKLKKKKGGLTI